MSRLVARAVRDLVAASPGHGTVVALLAGLTVEFVAIPGVAGAGAIVGDACWTEPAVGAIVATGLTPLLGGLVVGYATGDGTGIHALGHPAAWAYVVLPLVARWFVHLALLQRFAGPEAVLLGDTTFVLGVVTPVAIVGVVAGDALAPPTP